MSASTVKSSSVRKRTIVAVSVLAVIGILAFTPLPLIALHTVMSNTTMSHFEVDENRLEMTGAINKRSPQQLRDVLDENPQIETVVIAHVEGSIDDNSTYEMARLIRSRQLATEVPSGGLAESGGVHLFIAGVRRSLGPGAQLGVHEWRNFTNAASDYPPDDPIHEPDRAFVEEMLGSDDFYWFTIQAATWKQMHHLTNAEIERFGLVTP